MPATYQVLMNHISREHIGMVMNIYLDDIIIYSDTLEDYIAHMKIVFQILA